MIFCQIIILNNYSYYGLVSYKNILKIILYQNGKLSSIASILLMFLIFVPKIAKSFPLKCIATYNTIYELSNKQIKIITKLKSFTQNFPVVFETNIPLKNHILIKCLIQSVITHFVSPVRRPPQPGGQCMRLKSQRSPGLILSRGR